MTKLEEQSGSLGLYRSRVDNVFTIKYIFDRKIVRERDISTCI